ncbi:MAG: SHOCT domain-containing protein [Candidatus Limnocylindrales bacterium]
MFRGRFGIFRRPRLWRAALVGGLGFAAGRASKRSVEPAVPAQPGPAGGSESPQLTARLQELADLHASGALTDAEFAAAKTKLLAS